MILFSNFGVYPSAYKSQHSYLSISSKTDLERLLTLLSEGKKERIKEYMKRNPTQTREVTREKRIRKIEA